MTYFTIEEAVKGIEIWLVTGKLNPALLAENFKFSSPFWNEANKTEFIEQFYHSTAYQDDVLSKITDFDPVHHFIAQDKQHFAIVCQYHTKNGESVYETVLGKWQDGLVSELRSIYDLEATKKALEL